MHKLVFKNDDVMPQFGLGTWKSKPGDVYNAVRKAIDVGYRHIDCAYIYGNEKEIGKALADAMADGIKREELWITSKLWNSFHHPQNVRKGLRTSLDALGLDYLDLYLMHWPVAHKEGVDNPKSAADFVSLDEVPLIETWQAMERCVSSRLTRHIGVSNFSINKLKMLLDAARIKPELNQIEVHPYLQQTDVLTFCAGHDIAVTAYSPLGSADRAASTKKDNEPRLFDDPLIKQLAESYRVTPAQILIIWALQRGVAVIPKSVTPIHIEQNLEATQLSLTQKEMQAISELDRHYRFVDGSFWTLPGSGYTSANLWDE